MIKRLDVNDFRRAFYDYGRGEQFSYDALDELFDYYEECDEDMELDVIAICCDWSEYSTSELIESYDDYLTYEDWRKANDYTDNTDAEENEDYITDFISVIEQNTTIIKVSDDSYLVEAF